MLELVHRIQIQIQDQHLNLKRQRLVEVLAK
jgi:hypothetical protein